MKKILIFLTKYFYAIVSCLYLFTIGFFLAKNRILITLICKHFGYVRKKIEPIIPEVELLKLVSESVCIQIREPVVFDGNITLLETIVINRLIKFHKPEKLFEIGTFDGRTTINMASNCPDNANVYTLDLPKIFVNSTKLRIDPDDKQYINKGISGSRYLNADCKNKIIQLYGDSATFDFSPYFNSINFVFVDGSHSYEYVLNDSDKALKLLKNGFGIIVWHDYGGFDGVTKALNELYLKEQKFRNLKRINNTSLAILIL